MTPFSAPTAVSGYAERTERIVPGLWDLHRMVGVLLWFLQLFGLAETSRRHALWARLFRHSAK